MCGFSIREAWGKVAREPRSGQPRAKPAAVRAPRWLRKRPDSAPSPSQAARAVDRTAIWQPVLLGWGSMSALGDFGKQAPTTGNSPRPAYKSGGRRQGRHRGMIFGRTRGEPGAIRVRRDLRRGNGAPGWSEAKMNATTSDGVAEALSWFLEPVPGGPCELQPTQIKQALGGIWVVLGGPRGRAQPSFRSAKA